MALTAAIRASPKMSAPRVSHLGELAAEVRDLLVSGALRALGGMERVLRGGYRLARRARGRGAAWPL